MKTLRATFLNYCRDSSKTLETFDLLSDFYSEKHRVYHNLNHIKFLLELFENYTEFIEDKTCIFFAIWFHDAIYDPQRKDNEKQSANLAVNCLKEMGLPKEKFLKVEKLILATEKHSAANLDFDGVIFLDFDLAILGAEREVYENYAKAIREEYNFVSDSDYKNGRKSILQNFLKRETIYFTEVMRKKFEENARQNIEKEIEKMTFDL